MRINLICMHRHTAIDTHIHTPLHIYINTFLPIQYRCIDGLLIYPSKITRYNIYSAILEFIQFYLL